MKLLFTMLLIVGVFAGIYRIGMAAYGWFELSGLVEDIASEEVPKIVERAQQGGFGASTERFVKIRESILKGAQEAGVPVRPEDVAVNTVDNTLDVRVSWDAPMVTYQGKSYLEIPMSVQKSFSLARARR